MPLLRIISELRKGEAANPQVPGSWPITTPKAHPRAAHAGHDILGSFLELHFLSLRLAGSALKYWVGITPTYYTAGDWPGNPET